MSLDRIEENIEALRKLLDPTDNSTGGGTASAMAGAMGAALVAMVARLSIGKEGMEPAPFYKKIDSAGQMLTDKLLDGAYWDSEAFASVRRAQKMTQETHEEQVRRSKAVQSAWIQAARIPLLNAERCAEVMELARQLEGRSNPSADSDLKCAFYLARAGVLGCVANVEINLPFITDTALVTEMLDRANALRMQALAHELAGG